MNAITHVALVTGASRGIGPYIARALADAGYRLVLASRSGPELQAQAQMLNAIGAEAVAIPADLTDPESVEHLAAAAEKAFGRVDVLVNNAGGDPQQEFDAMTWAENETIVKLNLLAPIQLTRQLIPGMLSRGVGHVVNISSNSCCGSPPALFTSTSTRPNAFSAAAASCSTLSGSVRSAGIATTSAPLARSMCA